MGMAAGARVLVVDDHPVVCRTWKRLLKGRVAVDVAHSVEDAKNALKDGKYGGVLLDFSLPDGTAMDIMPTVRKKSGPVPILVVTGEEPDETLVNGVQAAGATFARKPLRQENLKAFLQRVVIGGKGRRALAKKLKMFDLTDRQREVLELCLRMERKEAARYLGVSDHSVKTTLARALKNCGVRTMRQMAARLLELE